MNQNPSPLPTQNILIKVGDIKNRNLSTHSEPKKGQKKPRFSYKDILFDRDGWADSEKYLPKDADLVYMRLRRNKTIRGWIFGKIWCGGQLREGDKVMFWKIEKEDEQ